MKPARVVVGRGALPGVLNLPSRLENCEDPNGPRTVKEEYRFVTFEGTGAPRQSNLGVGFATMADEFTLKVEIDNRWFLH